MGCRERGREREREREREEQQLDDTDDNKKERKRVWLRKINDRREWSNERSKQIRSSREKKVVPQQESGL